MPKPDDVTTALELCSLKLYPLGEKKTKKPQKQQQKKNKRTKPNPDLEMLRMSLT